MHARIPMFAFLAGAALLASAPSFAKLPSPANSHIPAGIRLVGVRDGVADPAGEFTVSVRSLSNNPEWNDVVSVDFSQCVAGGEIAIASRQDADQQFIDCAYHTVRAMTGQDGVAHFCIVGSAHNAGGAPGADAPCAVIYADGVLLGTVKVAAFDENGRGGVNPIDVSAWVGDLFAAGGKYIARSDFNGDGVVNGLDLASMAQVYFDARSIESAPANCP